MMCILNLYIFLEDMAFKDINAFAIFHFLTT